MATLDKGAKDVAEWLEARYTYGALGLDATSPAITQESLLQEAFRKEEDSSEFLTEKKFKKEFIVLSTEANGIIIKEFGLGKGNVFEVENFESIADWSAGGDAAISLDSTYSLFTGLNSMKIALTYSTGTGNASSTTSMGDVSAYTGISSGTPTMGWMTIFFYADDTSLLNATDAIEVRIGSSASDYLSAVFQASDLTDDTWVGLLVDMADGSNVTVTGTPDWTAVDYRNIIIKCTATTDVYIDNWTLSELMLFRVVTPQIEKTNLKEIAYEVDFEVINTPGATI